MGSRGHSRAVTVWAACVCARWLYLLRLRDALDYLQRAGGGPDGCLSTLVVAMQVPPLASPLQRVRGSVWRASGVQLARPPPPAPGPALLATPALQGPPCQLHCSGTWGGKRWCMLWGDSALTRTHTLPLSLCRVKAVGSALMIGGEEGPGVLSAPCLPQMYLQLPQPTTPLSPPTTGTLLGHTRSYDMHISPSPNNNTHAYNRTLLRHRPHACRPAPTTTRPTRVHVQRSWQVLCGLLGHVYRLPRGHLRVDPRPHLGAVHRNLSGGVRGAALSCTVCSAAPLCSALAAGIGPVHPALCCRCC